MMCLVSSHPPRSSFHKSTPNPRRVSPLTPTFAAKTMHPPRRMARTSSHRTTRASWRASHQRFVSHMLRPRLTGPRSSSRRTQAVPHCRRFATCSAARRTAASPMPLAPRLSMMAMCSAPSARCTAGTSSSSGGAWLRALWRLSTASRSRRRVAGRHLPAHRSPAPLMECCQLTSHLYQRRLQARGSSVRRTRALRLGTWRGAFRDVFSRLHPVLVPSVPPAENFRALSFGLARRSQLTRPMLPSGPIVAAALPSWALFMSKTATGTM